MYDGSSIQCYSGIEDGNDNENGNENKNGQYGQ